MAQKIKKNRLPSELVKEIGRSLNDLDGWGSLEIFVQNNKIVQITHRSIRKTNHDLK